MPSKPTEARSISSQLVLLFTAAGALLLCCGLGLLYWIVIEHAFEEDNEAMADKLFAVRADLASAGGPEILHQQLNTPRPRERVTYLIRVVDGAAHVVAESPGMNDQVPRQGFPKEQSSPASTLSPTIYRKDGKFFALAVVREELSGQPYTIHLAQDRSVDDEFTKYFGLLVATLLAVGSVASALIAITVTRRGLRPLAEITRSLERTGPTHLHERVEPTSWPRELQPIAIAFDQMLDRLEDSFTRLSQFSADLAHELRTPVANLRGEAEVALRRPRTPEEYREVIESSVAECERLSGIIDNLLFLARADAAQGLAERTTFDVRAAAEKIASYFGTVADERQVAIECQGIGEIYADETLFERALSNLVDNALRFTPDHGRIEISISSGSDAVEVSVKDNGRGIEARHLPRIFDRFYRADPSRSSEGTGLGLALVKSIAELHGGSADVESELGRGTRITLSFPREANESPS